jgi:hypothetical protein
MALVDVLDYEVDLRNYHDDIDRLVHLDNEVYRV